MREKQKLKKTSKKETQDKGRIDQTENRGFSHF